MQPAQRVHDLVDQARHDAEARLVEHEETRARHERAGNGQHLRLAAAERPRALLRPLAEHGEEGVDAFQHLAPVGRIAVAVAAERQVLEAGDGC